MRRVLSSVILASSMLAPGLLVPIASAQYGYSYSRPPYERRDRALFDRVRMDLDRAANYPYASRGDRKRFDEARRELFDFESRFDRGRYERHELDQAISKLQHVVERNSLEARDRGALSEDLRLMRDFRSFREHDRY